MKKKDHQHFRTFSQLGHPEAPNAAPADKKFEDLVRFYAARFQGDRAKAVGFCVKAYPQKHVDYLARVKAGEVIVF